MCLYNLLAAMMLDSTNVFKYKYKVLIQMYFNYL